MRFEVWGYWYLSSIPQNLSGLSSCLPAILVHFRNSGLGGKLAAGRMQHTADTNLLAGR